MPRCQHIKDSGDRCRASALARSGFCFFHDPDRATEREAARRAGGLANRPTVLSVAPRTPLKTASKVALLIAQTIHQTRRGELDPKVANSVGYLSNILLKALEHENIEEQLELLEGVLMTTTNEDLSMDHLVEEDTE